jgi:hypothetical protein
MQYIEIQDQLNDAVMNTVLKSNSRYLKEDSNPFWESGIAQGVTRKMTWEVEVKRLDAIQMLGHSIKRQTPSLSKDILLLYGHPLKTVRAMNQRKADQLAYDEVSQSILTTSIVTQNGDSDRYQDPITGNTVQLREQIDPANYRVSRKRWHEIEVWLEKRIRGEWERLGVKNAAEREIREHYSLYRKLFGRHTMKCVPKQLVIGENRVTIHHLNGLSEVFFDKSDQDRLTYFHIDTVYDFGSKVG